MLQRRSISVGKNRDTLIVVALTKQGARLVRQDDQLPFDQAIYAGFVKPAEVPHDAAIYAMYQAEAAEIEARGGKVRRVVLDYELKKNVYSKLAKERESGALEYARRQQEIAKENHLPVVDGKIALPDLRIEYETPEGDLDHVDLELATEHYHRGHMARENARWLQDVRLRFHFTRPASPVGRPRADRQCALALEREQELTL